MAHVLFLSFIFSSGKNLSSFSSITFFGFFTYFAIAGVYYVVPVITKKPLWSKKLADWHFTLFLLGSILFFCALWIGGVLQGMQWASWANGSSYAQFHNNLSNLPFVQTIGDVWIWWVLRLIGGIFILIGALLFVVNIFNTIILKPKESLALESSGV